MTQEIDPADIDTQVGLAMGALAVAVAHALREARPNIDPLENLQRTVQMAHSRLRQTPNAERAVAMFRFVIQALRNPNVIAQPEDDA